MSDEARATVDDDHRAAAAFLARYSGRTLEAYRHDLRCFFQWAGDHRIEVLASTRAHIEMYRASMDERGLAASTIDRHPSTVCGYFRFARINGRIPSHPPCTCAAPRSNASTAMAWIAVNSAGSCSPPSTTPPTCGLAVLLGPNGLRISEACATSVEDLGFERGHRTLRTIGKGNKPAVIPLVPRTPALSIWPVK